MKELSLYKIWCFLYLFKVCPLIYGYIYENFKKLPYPDFIEAITMLVLVPPIFLSEIPGMSWMASSTYSPSTLGIIVSLLIWVIIDIILAYVVYQGIMIFSK
jgi:hypothetical protein